MAFFRLLAVRHGSKVCGWRGGLRLRHRTVAERRRRWPLCTRPPTWLGARTAVWAGAAHLMRASVCSGAVRRSAEAASERGDAEAKAARMCVHPGRKEEKIPKDALLSSPALDVRLMTALQVLQVKENVQHQRGMGGRHAATTQGFHDPKLGLGGLRSPSLQYSPISSVATSWAGSSQISDLGALGVQSLTSHPGPGS